MPAERFEEEVSPGTPNNFVQIFEQGGGDFAIYGVEEFSNQSVVNMANGQPSDPLNGLSAQSKVLVIVRNHPSKVPVVPACVSVTTSV
jgi:hypothetical protein